MADIIDVRGKNAQPASFSRESAFRAARSHSRLVRFLKIAVPATAFAGAALFVFFAWFNPFRAANFKVDVGQVGVAGDKLVMELPHLTGFNKRQQAYNVTAKTATQRITVPGLIDLDDLKAIITMVDKSTATMTAKGGKFDSNAEILNVHNDVKVLSTKGYDVAMQSGTIDFKAGTVVSKDPVTVKLTNGVINANGLNIINGGGTITFKDGVSAQFQTPLKPQPDATDATGSVPSIAPSPSNPVQGTPAP